MCIVLPPSIVWIHHGKKTTSFTETKLYGRSDLKIRIRGLKKFHLKECRIFYFKSKILVIEFYEPEGHHIIRIMLRDG